MTGDKPDPRLRTPMHWNDGPAAGFTSGVPWEPLQPDSATANVEAMEADPASLLNLYRRLIHVRAANAALGAGELIPLDAGTAQAAAYLRSTGTDIALVIANLGTTPLMQITLSSRQGALAEGRYSPQVLLGDGPAAQLEVGADGRIADWGPMPALAPFETRIFQLTR